jgi:chemotaxis protein methyltransferase CheR
VTAEGNGQASLPNDVFRILAGLILERSGIEFGEANRFLLESRVAYRIRELRLDGMRSYLYHLRYGPAGASELDALVDRVTNPETYFFREPDQLAAFSDEVVPAWEASASPDDTLRVWSAGCASGEEPYTLAMLLDERGVFGRREVDIVGSDISTTSLARARSALYRENSFRQTSEERRARFFELDAPGRFRLRSDIRNRVSFGRANLIEPARLSALSRFDVIFCRNVLIYLSEPAKRTVVEALYDRLKPGGHLFLGRVESLVAFATAFRLRHLERDMVYQK